MFNAFLEPCSSSGIRSNEVRVVTAVVLFTTIPLTSPEVTDYSIRRQLVARLKSDRHNVDAAAGAGLAAFELGRYSLAERYLKAAVTANPKDAESAARLKTTELVLRMDPFQRNLPDTRRSQIVVDAFAAAGQRLNSCNIQNASLVSDGGQPVLAEIWQSMKPRITPWGLRRDPDLVERAMDLVFRIERETGASCGAPSETDTALLLVGKSHEGS